MTLSRLLIIWFALASFALSGHEEPRRAVNKQMIDEFLSVRYDGLLPGIMIRVIDEGGHRLYDGSCGLPPDGEAVFKIASLTKTFTAVLVMQAVEKGRLKLDQPFNEILGNTDFTGSAVTIRQLLSHTSGIANYTALPEYRSIKDKMGITPDRLLAMVAKKPSDFVPGERFRYSNSNYIILGELLSVLYGKTLAVLMKERIFCPLAMERTGFGQAKSTDPGFIRGYVQDSGEWKPAENDDIAHTAAAGGLQSSMNDLTRFWLALISHKLVSQKTLHEMASISFAHQDGRPEEYGMGLWIFDFHGQTAFKGAGFWNGYQTQCVHYPQAGISILAFSNGSGIQQSQNFDYEVNWVAFSLLKRPYPVFRAQLPVAGSLDAFTGVYRLSEDTVRWVSRQGNTLFTLRNDSNRLQASWAGGDRFFYANTFTYFDFLRNVRGEVTAMRMNSPDGCSEAVRVFDIPMRKAVDVAPQFLDRLAGRYDFGFAVFSVRAEGQRLKVDNGRFVQWLLPKGGMGFFKEEDDTHWRFESYETGSVTGLHFRFGKQRLHGRKIE